MPHQQPGLYLDCNSGKLIVVIMTVWFFSEFSLPLLLSGHLTCYRFCPPPHPKGDGQVGGGFILIHVFIQSVQYRQEFVTSKHWVHLDIAGVMGNKDEVPYLSKGMSGENSVCVLCPSVCTTQHCSLFTLNSNSCLTIIPLEMLNATYMNFVDKE